MMPKFFGILGKIDWLGFRKLHFRLDHRGGKGRNLYLLKCLILRVSCCNVNSPSLYLIQFTEYYSTGQCSYVAYVEGRYSAQTMKMRSQLWLSRARQY
ncbi:hypothetical protein IEQ34_011414 [Dendrobium chrysotoxum]|uniref:Uncharacterized protein n=1 Tax=Dendrobium chrysotoxum TaxID=161865 RepID=A0AAV7GTM0_DENCH|nr:hypothetical protein IEQ34_011414 [Dendrobium chrysotoxum]